MADVATRFKGGSLVKQGNRIVGVSELGTPGGSTSFIRSDERTTDSSVPADLDTTYTARWRQYTKYSA